MRNRGHGPSDTTTLRYYRSTDSTISIGDTEVGTDQVSGLNASGTSAESIGLTAPSTPGKYYYGACVDSVTGESDTSDNCSSAVTLTVGSGNTYGVGDLLPGVPTTGLFIPAVTVGASLSSSGGDTTITFTNGGYIELQDGTRYTCQSTGGCGVHNGEVTQGTIVSQTTSALTSDLIVDPPTVSEGAPAAGARFTLSATVRNQGSGSADPTTLRYYRSTDSAITNSDTSVGTDSVSGLNSSGSGDESISLTAPSTPGTYYYGACVDAVTGESDTTNNCSAAVTVVVGAAPAPDLVVDTPTVDTSAPAAGARFTLSATVRNRGSVSSGSTILGYYRSTDTTITTSDTTVGSYVNAVSSLSPSGSSDHSINLTAPSTPGTYYYGACVGAVTGENDTANNCSEAVTVALAGTPDLVVDTPTVSDSGVIAAATFTISATVRNQGNGASASTWLHHYLSTDATITRSDTLLSNIYVEGLSPSGSSAKWYNLTAPATAGTYYYGACVDSVTGESDTTNNCSPAVTITVGAAPAPDLVVDAPTVSDNAPAAGARFTLSATVRNQGSGSADSATLRYYRSTDSTITTGDTEVDTDFVSSLGASGSGDESVSLTAPSTSGTYYYGACVDAVSGESNTGNNCSSAVTMTVGAPTSADLVVESLVSGRSGIGYPTVGASFTLSVTVHNRGTGSSDPTTLRYYRSTDSSITTGDTEVGTDSVSGLSASGTSNESITLTYPSAPGTYYHGACVDPVAGESDTTNNCSSGLMVTVAAPDSPDLVVEPPTVSDSSPTAGAFFTLNATVRNRGNGPSATTTLYYWRATVTESSIGGFSEVGTDTVDTLAASGASNMSISLTAPATPGMYDFFVSVNPVPGESNTNNNYSDLVRITVQSAMKPGAPTGLSATADGQTEIDLSWTAPSDDGGTNITGYKIEVSTDGSSWSDLEANTRSTSTTYSHTGLTAGSTRYYRVLAINVAGTGTASNTDSATTNSPPNRAPVAIGTIPDWTSSIYGWEYLDVSSYFSDPDDDALSYGAVSSDTAVVISYVAAGRVLIRAYSFGTARVTVTARDPGGLEATQTIAVRVNGRPEAVGTIPGQTIEVGQTITVDVSPYFRDSNEDLLAYEAVAGDALMVSMSGSTVSITGVSMAFVTGVTVTARDPYGLSTSQQITMGVRTAVANPVPNDITLRLNSCFVFQEQHFVMFEVKARVSVSSLVVKTYQVEGRNNTKHLMETIHVGSLEPGSSYTELTTGYFPAHLRRHLTTCTADANWDSGTVTPGFLQPTTAVPDLPPPSPPDTPIPQERLVPTQGQVTALWISLDGSQLYRHYQNCGSGRSPPCPSQDHVAYWSSLPSNLQRCAFEGCVFH